MGLIQALFDEIIPLPKQADYEIIGNKEMICINRLGFSFLNLIFQTIDCVVIPFVTLYCFSGKIQLGLFNWVIIIFGGLASIFSIFQFLYYFFFPVEKYLNPVHGRIFGETAVGGFIAALFKIKINTYIE
jgi:hypothetical protein